MVLGFLYFKLADHTVATFIFYISYIAIIVPQPAIFVIFKYYTNKKQNQTKQHQTYIETFAKIYMYHSNLLNIEKQA